MAHDRPELAGGVWLGARPDRHRGRPCHGSATSVVNGGLSTPDARTVRVHTRLMGDNAIRTSVRLDDGRRVDVRPIGGADTSALRAMHLRLSTLSVQRRFFALLRELPLDQAERFTHVDGLDRAALVAEAGDGSIVGVARYDRASGTATAEIAIVVEDAYQHHGLGTSLLEALGSDAQLHGIDHFTADVQDDNRPMFRTLDDAGLAVQARELDHGVDHLVLTFRDR